MGENETNIETAKIIRFFTASIILNPKLSLLSRWNPNDAWSLVMFQNATGEKIIRINKIEKTKCLVYSRLLFSFLDKAKNRNKPKPNKTALYLEISASPKKHTDKYQ